MKIFKRISKLEILKITVPVFCLSNISLLLLCGIFLLPQYFGLALGFAFTVLRLTVLLFLIVLITNSRITRLRELAFHMNWSVWIWGFAFVTLYTAVCRADVNTFLGGFFDNILPFFLLLYIIKYVCGLEKCWEMLTEIFGLVALLGIAEGIVRQNPYRLLHTINISGGGAWRGGMYRIGGMCSHPIGFGMYILLMIAFVCVDVNKKKISVFKHKLIFLALIIDMLLTGSRSTIGIMALEIFVLFCFSSTKDKIDFFKVVGLLIAVGSIIILLFRNTSVVQYILLQVTQVTDYLFGTQIAVDFGGTIEIQNSNEYREYLPYVITDSKILNPWVGLGTSNEYTEIIRGKNIDSIDNYYVETYISFGYPGLILRVIMFSTIIFDAVRNAVKQKNLAIMGLAIGMVCYFIALWYADALGTMKQAHGFMAIEYALCYFKPVSKVKEEYI